MEHLPGWEKSKSIAGRLDNRRSDVRRLSSADDSKRQEPPRPLLAATCPTGRSFDSKTTACDYCTDGKFQDQSTAASATCKFCPAGYKYVSTTASCTQCQAGQYQASSSTSFVACQSCAAGMHQTATGQSSCDQNVCSCTNGVEATGTACTTHGANICSSCSSEYTLDGDLCVARQACSDCSGWSFVYGAGHQGRCWHVRRQGVRRFY